ncbi:unnamed protein product [Cladocopium goreaui]|uniref:Uncharacterized protein n=1 Tax=Cladocopium goreaui TaxID=2562237 RepID=A0A9P1DNJ6_9DINO|nr:unnamed protein product [Cladocopium goreaui]
MQCPCLIVRVGPPASNQYVRACLDVLQNVLDYRVTEAACRLEEVGVAKHSSWRFVALHGSLGNLSIPPMPSSGKLFVRDVQPVEKNMPLAFVVGWRRIAELEDFWQKLRHSKCSFTGKARAVRTVAWPRSLHAISNAPVGDSVWTELRRRTKWALSLDKAGVNSHLLGLLEFGLDPQYAGLLQTIKDARTFQPLDFCASLVFPCAVGALDLPPNSAAQIALTRVQLYLVGGSVTEDMKSKWSGRSNVCVWCGQEDSLRHRFWICPKYATQRLELAPDALRLLPDIPGPLALRGWAL